MDSKFGRDMTVGSIPGHLLTFAIPMLIGNVLQVGYSVINAIWVGNIIGNDAIGATAVSFPILFILLGIAGGATMATTILVAQYYGAKDHDMVQKVVSNSFSVAFILGVILSLAGIFSSDYLLVMMGTPAEIFAMASSYLKISIGGFLLMYLSFLIASILRGIGDTKTPLVFMAIGLGLNAILDPLLIIGVGPLPKLGLNGAAIASLISQGVGLLLSILYLNRKNHLVAVKLTKLNLDMALTTTLFRIGFPSIIQQCLVSIGSAFITTYINAFGVTATNAFGAASRIDQIAFMPAMSLGMAASALTGQNLGAKKPDRVMEIFKWGTVMTSAITLLITLLAVSAPRVILSAFGLKGADLDIGVTYLHYVGSCYIFFAVMFVSNGIINGAGHTITTMIFSLLALWMIRIPLAAILSKSSLGIIGIWISISFSFLVLMVVSLFYYFSGIWKKPVVKHRKLPVRPEPEPES